MLPFSETGEIVRSTTWGAWSLNGSFTMAGADVLRVLPNVKIDRSQKRTRQEPGAQRRIGHDAPASAFDRRLVSHIRGPDRRFRPIPGERRLAGENEWQNASPPQ